MKHQTADQRKSMYLAMSVGMILFSSHAGGGLLREIKPIPILFL